MPSLFSLRPQSLSGIFEKFKEKKVNVVTALREAADAVYLTVRSLIDLVPGVGLMILCVVKRAIDSLHSI